MLVFTLALLIAARPDLDNPGCYRNSWDWARLVFEILSFLYFVWKLYDEGFEIFRLVNINEKSTCYAYFLKRPVGN